MQCELACNSRSLRFTIREFKHGDQSFSLFRSMYWNFRRLVFLLPTRESVGYGVDPIILRGVPNQQILERQSNAIEYRRSSRVYNGIPGSAECEEHNKTDGRIVAREQVVALPLPHGRLVLNRAVHLVIPVIILAFWVPHKFL